MTQTRVYVPLTVDAVVDLVNNRECFVAGIAACAVTDALRKEFGPGLDDEALEYQALLEAASGEDVVAVAAADVAPAVVEQLGDGALSAVHLAEPLRLRRVVSFHVRDGDDLLWYDVTEASVVASMISPS